MNMMHGANMIGVPGIRRYVDRKSAVTMPGLVLMTCGNSAVHEVISGLEGLVLRD